MKPIVGFNPTNDFNQLPLPFMNFVLTSGIYI